MGGSERGRKEPRVSFSVNWKLKSPLCFTLVEHVLIASLFRMRPSDTAALAGDTALPQTDETTACMELYFSGREKK